MERHLEDATVAAPQISPEQREQLLALGDDLEQLWDHPNSPVTLKKRILRAVLQEIVADTTDGPPTVHLKLHWIGGSHTELTVRKNKTGYHNHINSEEVTEMIRELALVCEDSAIVSILNRLVIAPATATPGRRSVCNTFATLRAFRLARYWISVSGSPCSRPLLRSPLAMQ